MKLSGYTTSRNAIDMNYPIKESIQSLLNFCDEVVVLDSSDKSDGTKDLLSDLKNQNKNSLKVYTAHVDWSAPNHGIFDGALKQAAREKCTGDLLWQMDLDEVVHAVDRVALNTVLQQVQNLENIPILCLPVVEYWGSNGKVRVDVNPWKWRVSRNRPDITHGIPVSHRQMINGLLYAKPGTDGCDYISKSTGTSIPNMNFVNSQIEQLRQAAIHNDQATSQYEQWFNNVVNTLPTVYHYSWFSIEEKIRKYKMFWSNFWPSLYGQELNKDNVFFPGVDWKDVTDEMIKQKAKELEENTGGHIFHTPWMGQKTNSIRIYRDQPELIKTWTSQFLSEQQ